MATQMQLEIFWREIAWLTASCEAETIKASIKTRKLKSGNCFISVLSKVLAELPRAREARAWAELHS